MELSVTFDHREKYATDFFLAELGRMGVTCKKDHLKCGDIVCEEANVIIEVKQMQDLKNNITKSYEHFKGQIRDLRSNPATRGMKKIVLVTGNPYPLLEQANWKAIFTLKERHWIAEPGMDPLYFEFIRDVSPASLFNFLKAQKESNNNNNNPHSPIAEEGTATQSESAVERINSSSRRKKADTPRDHVEGFLHHICKGVAEKTARKIAKELPSHRAFMEYARKHGEHFLSDNPEFIPEGAKRGIPRATSKRIFTSLGLGPS